MHLLRFCRGQKSRGLGTISHDPECDDRHHDSEQPLEDEDPCPAWTTANAPHFVDPTSEETAEGAGHGGCGEEDGGAEGAFAAGVPEGDVVIDSLLSIRHGKHNECESWDLTGKRPDSAVPRKTRAISSPLKSFTRPVRVMVIPHANIMIGNHIDCG